MITDGFVRSFLDTSRATRICRYELWAVNPQDTLERPQRVSLGTFTTAADGSARLTAFTAAPADRFPVVGVTLEPVDGNPARTGPRVLAPGPSG